jgi:hypothetical protein
VLGHSQRGADFRSSLRPKLSTLPVVYHGAVLEEPGEADVWVAETDAEPGWAITPAHMRMW